MTTWFSSRSGGFCVGKGERAQDGETDFLICHPNQGCLCVEVKGGGVGFDAATGQWFSIDRHRRKHGISNPVEPSPEGEALRSIQTRGASPLAGAVAGQSAPRARGFLSGHCRRRRAEQGGSAGRAGWHRHGSPRSPGVDRFGFHVLGKQRTEYRSAGPPGRRCDPRGVCAIVRGNPVGRHASWPSRKRAGSR